MEQNIKRCAVFGQNTICFDWGFDEDDEYCGRMKDMLLQELVALRQQGVMDFLVACDHGVGLYAAELVLRLRQTDPELALTCVIPHEEQSTKWAPYLRERYFKVLEDCTGEEYISYEKQPDAQLLAYKRIIDLADTVLTVFDDNAPSEGRVEAQARLYAENLHKPILNLDPRTWKDRWAELR